MNLYARISTKFMLFQCVCQFSVFSLSLFSLLSLSRNDNIKILNQRRETNVHLHRVCVCVCGNVDDMLRLDLRTRREKK